MMWMLTSPKRFRVPHKTPANGASAQAGKQKSWGWKWHSSVRRVCAQVRNLLLFMVLWHPKDINGTLWGWNLNTMPLIVVTHHDGADEQHTHGERCEWDAGKALKEMSSVFCCLEWSQSCWKLFWSKNPPIWDGDGVLLSCDKSNFVEKCF